MYDINHYFSADVLLSGTGDFSVVKDTTMTQQRILRRLLTNPGDYIWHPDYGAGVGAYVGATADKIPALKALITSQMYLEDAVSQNPAPEISIETDLTTLTCTIKYYEKDNPELQVLSFTLGA